MSNRNHNSFDDNKDETPPYSRIFIVCSRDMKDEDLTKCFEKFGEIENLYIPKDRNTGTPRGVAYIKYAKTSSAAAAIDALHGETICDSKKPIKVMIASKKNEKSDDSNMTHDRLFIKISKQTTEDEVRDVFSKYGTIETVHVLKDKNTNENKGLAYIKFQSFYDAAKAMEECDKKYRAVFAAPKSDLKRMRSDRDTHDPINPFYSGRDQYNDYFNGRNDMMQQRDRPIVAPLIKTPPSNYKCVNVTCTPGVPQRHLERLFNIVPGMQHFQYTEDKYNGMSKAVVTYEDERAAAHAVDRLNHYVYPSGEMLTVKPDNPLTKAADDLTSIVSSFRNAVDNGTPDLVQLADAIAQASTLIKAATTGRVDTRESEGKFESNLCSVPLPPLRPLAPPSSAVAQRCFVICKPQPPPMTVLQDIFCRFGDLIEVSFFPFKTYGFAKYASTEAAEKAISTLHGATIFGTIRMKVLEAEEPKSSRHNNQEDMDHDGDRKRMRLDGKEH